MNEQKHKEAYEAISALLSLHQLPSIDTFNSPQDALSAIVDNIYRIAADPTRNGGYRMVQDDQIRGAFRLADQFLKSQQQNK